MPDSESHRYGRHGPHAWIRRRKERIRQKRAAPMSGFGVRIVIDILLFERIISVSSYASDNQPSEDGYHPQDPVNDFREFNQPDETGNSAFVMGVQACEEHISQQCRLFLEDIVILASSEASRHIKKSKSLKEEFIAFKDDYINGYKFFLGQSLGDVEPPSLCEKAKSAAHADRESILRNGGSVTTKELEVYADIRGGECLRDHGIAVIEADKILRVFRPAYIEAFRAYTPPPQEPPKPTYAPPPPMPPAPPQQTLPLRADPPLYHPGWRG